MSETEIDLIFKNINSRGTTTVGSVESNTGIPDFIARMVAEDAECLTLDSQGIIRALCNANCPGCALNGCIRSRGELKKLPAPAQPQMVQESKATHDSDDGFEIRADSTNTLTRLETRVDPFDDNDWQQDPRPRFLKEKKHGGTVDHETIPDGFAAEEIPDERTITLPDGFTAKGIPDVKIKWKLLEDSPHKKTIRQLANAGTHRIYINGQDQFDFSPLTTIKFILSSHETQRQRYLDFIQKIYSPLELRELFNDLQAGDYSALKSQIHKLCNALGDSIEEAIIDKTDPILYMERWGITIQDARQLLIQFRRTQYNIPKPASYRTDYDAIAMAGQILAGRALPDGRQPVNLRTAVAAAATETNTPSSFDQVETCIVAPNAPLATSFNQDDLIRTMSGDESLKGKDRMRCVQKGKKDGQYYFQDILEDLRYPLDLLISILEGRTQDIGISIQALEQCISKISNINPCYDCALKRAKGLGCVLYDMYDVASYQLILAARNFEFVQNLMSIRPLLEIDEPKQIEINNPTLSGIIPERFPVPPKYELTKPREDIRIELADDYNVQLTFEDERLVGIRYPNAALAEIANWPDPKYLYYDRHRTDYGEDVDVDSLIQLQSLNDSIREFKMFVIQDQASLSILESLYSNILSMRIPFGNELLRDGLHQELESYMELKRIEFKYREHIASMQGVMSITNPSLPIIMGELMPIYERQTNLTRQDIIDILGLGCTVNAFAYYQYNIFGQDRTEGMNAKRTHYSPSDVLVLYQTYLQPGVNYEQVPNFLNLKSIRDGESDFVARALKPYGLPPKARRIVDRKLGEKIYNLETMTDLTEENVKIAFIGLGVASVNQILREHDLPMIDKTDKTTTVVKRSLTFSQAVQASRIMINRNLTLDQTIDAIGGGISSAALSTSLKRLGIARFDRYRNVDRSTNNPDCIDFSRKDGTPLRIVRNGSEYIIFHPYTLEFATISKLAHAYLITFLRQNGISNLDAYNLLVKYGREEHFRDEDAKLMISKIRLEIENAVKIASSQTPEP